MFMIIFDVFLDTFGPKNIASRDGCALLIGGSFPLFFGALCFPSFFFLSLVFFVVFPVSFVQELQFAAKMGNFTPSAPTPSELPESRSRWSYDRERKISPKFFRPKFFRGRPRGMSVPKCLFSQDLEGLTEVFGRMSAGTSG